MTEEIFLSILSKKSPYWQVLRKNGGQVKSESIPVSFFQGLRFRLKTSYFHVLVITNRYIVLLETGRRHVEHLNVKAQTGTIVLFLDGRKNSHGQRLFIK